MKKILILVAIVWGTSLSAQFKDYLKKQKAKQINVIYFRLGEGMKEKEIAGANID